MMPNPKAITIIKRNVAGEETFRYHGRLLEARSGAYTLEAHFERPDMNINGLQFKRGDRFLETWYTDRWYNIFEIHAGDDDHLRGWYCNIGRPAEYAGGELSYIDLGLDLLVFPDGKQVVLDEDEFEQMDLDPDTRQKARQALHELQGRFAQQLG